MWSMLPRTLVTQTVYLSLVSPSQLKIKERKDCSFFPDFLVVMITLWNDKGLFLKVASKRDPVCLALKTDGQFLRMTGASFAKLSLFLQKMGLLNLT